MAPEWRLAVPFSGNQRLVNFSMPLQAQSGETVAHTYLHSPSSRLRT